MHEARTGRNDVPRRAIDLSPRAIVRHHALTLREKIELLEDLRLQLGGDLAGGTADFGTSDIDAAIRELHQSAASGRTAPMAHRDASQRQAGGRN